MSLYVLLFWRLAIEISILKVQCSQRIPSREKKKSGDKEELNTFAHKTSHFLPFLFRI